jgi:ketopantoate reductase
MKIGIVGAGGRTGTMFFQELRTSAQVFGIGKKEEIEKIKKGKLFVEKKGKKEIVEGEFVEEKEFPRDLEFDFLFLTTKNPVGQVLKYYYQKIKEKNLKLPILFLSQNGIEAGKETLSVLKEIFGEKAKEVSIFRISLFTPVDKKTKNDKTFIVYPLPIKMAMAKFYGNVNEDEVFDFFKKTDFEISFFSQRKVKDMEYSKLFLNLIGMASATHGLSIFEGFSKKEVFKEEFLAIKEYIKVIKKAKRKFLNFPHYPVKFLSLLFYLPFSILLPFRKILAKKIERGREEKPKSLNEIDYYNGAVIKLGREVGVETPVNEKILKRAKSCLLKALG